MSHLRVVPPDRNIAPFNCRVVLVRTTPGPAEWGPLDRRPFGLSTRIHSDSTGWGTVAVDEAWIARFTDTPVLGPTHT